MGWMPSRPMIDGRRSRWWIKQKQREDRRRRESHPHPLPTTLYYLRHFHGRMLDHFARLEDTTSTLSPCRTAPVDGCIPTVQLFDVQVSYLVGCCRPLFPLSLSLHNIRQDQCPLFITTWCMQQKQRRNVETLKRRNPYRHLSTEKH